MLTSHEVTILFLSVGLLLFCARVLGELARRFHQPAVLGEIAAGICLGPTVLGALAPGTAKMLFPAEGPIAAGLESLTTLAIALFLLVSGTEVDLSMVWRRGRSALAVSVTGMVIPFALGFVTAWFVPDLIGGAAEIDPRVFSLFFATALSISALPVVSKILFDLNLFRTDIGTVVVASAIVNDVIGWVIFAVLIGMLSGNGAGGADFIRILAWTLGFAALLLTVGRWLIDRILPWVQAHFSYPGGVLGFAVSVALFSAAFTEWIGIHAIFGAFLFGVALGGSPHLRVKTRATFDQFISFIFAPLFFASIGLRVNFIESFDLLPVAAVFVIATTGKVLGCSLGARWSGLSQRESWAIGFGMNARGAMEIILGLLAFQVGIISERLFVALVVMALLTSMTSGMLMEKILRRKKPVRFSDFMSSKHFEKDLKGSDRYAVIEELSERVCLGTGLDPRSIAKAVWEREQIVPTGLGHSLAVPHARLESLKQPLLALGISRHGVDFDAPDGRPARLVLLILTPAGEPESQIEIFADISRAFQSPDMVEAVLRAESYTELLSAIKSA